jgi:DNA mismatch repair protein MutS2
MALATTHLGSLKDLASHTPGIVNASLQFDAATLTPTYRLLKGIPGRSYGLAIARRLGVSNAILADAEERVPDAARNLDILLAAVEERERELRAAQATLAERSVELESLAARLAVQQEQQASRESELKRREKTAEREGRQQAKAYLLDARQRVEEALATARGAVDEAAAREARRTVEEGIQGKTESPDKPEKKERADQVKGVPGSGDRVRLPSGGTGEVLEVRSDGKLVVALGAMRMVLDASELEILAETKSVGARPPPSPTSSPSSPSSPSSLEVDLRGMTGDEAEQATVAAVDAAVLAEQPYLRIIHGMGTGVVRERVQRVVSRDRRISRYAFAPRNQGGTGVTIVEFSA